MFLSLREKKSTGVTCYLLWIGYHNKGIVQPIQPLLWKYTLCDKLVLFGEGIKTQTTSGHKPNTWVQKNGQDKHSQGAERIAIRIAQKRKGREK